MTQVIYQCSYCSGWFAISQGTPPIEHLCLPRIMAAVEKIEMWEKEKQDKIESQEFSVTIEKSDLAMGMPARINRLSSPAIGNNTEVRAGDRGRGNDGIDFVAGLAKKPNQSVGNDDPVARSSAVNSGMGGFVLEQQHGNFNTRKDE